MSMIESIVLQSHAHAGGEGQALLLRDLHFTAG
jgi:hypothetical protein